MEEINSKKTEAFLTAIKTLADEECKSIDEETDRLRVERLRALQKEAEDRYKSYTEYETARIKADCNSAVSECEERSRKELTDLRAELCKKVFDAAGEKINEYTKTDSYREKLVSSAKEIAEALKNCKAAAIMDRCESYNGNGGPLGSEVPAALFKNKVMIEAVNYILQEEVK